MKTDEQAVSPDETKVTLKSAVSDFRESARKSDEKLRPFYRGVAPTVTTGALLGTAEVIAALPDAWAYAGAASVAVGAAGVGVSFIGRASEWLKDNTPGLLWSRVAMAASSGWLAVSSLTANGGPVPLVLLGGALAMSIPWWHKYHLRIGESLPEPLPEPVMTEVQPDEPEPQPEPEDDRQIEASIEWIWDNKIVNPGSRSTKDNPLGTKGGPLAGTEITGWVEGEYGKTTEAWLPDNILSDEAIGATRKITQLYRKRIGEVMIEQHADQVEGHLQITILHTPPIWETRIWQGPCLDPLTGLMPLGLYADGQGLAQIQLFELGHGMKHLLICGGTGSGKSRLLGNIIASIEHSGVGVTWLADPQGGQSVPDWAQEGALDRIATDTDSVKVMIKAAYEVMMANSAYLAKVEWVDEHGRTRKGKQFMDPTPDMPFLALIIDEVHMVASDAETARYVAAIAKMGRKAGVLLILSTQTPTQMELGGPAGGAIRDNVTMGNVVILRTRSRMTSTMLALPVDPARLPKTFPNGKKAHGVGFVMGEGTRDVMMRVDFDPDPFRWVTLSPHTRLHPTAEKAAEEAYANAELVVSGGDGVEAPTKLPTSMPFPEEYEAAVQPSRQEAKEQEKAKTRILGYIAKYGPATPKRLRLALDISEGWIFKVLKELLASEALMNEGGVYHLPSQMDAFEDEPDGFEEELEEARV